MSELIYYDLKSTGAISSGMAIQVARELGRRIVSGVYDEHCLLDDEATLSSRYQVSRVVIRDAIKILVSKGLLEVRRGIGTKVKGRGSWVLFDDDVLAWHLSAPPNADFLNRLMEIRLAFEPKAAKWAAERATPEDIKNIELACNGMKLEAYTEADELSVNKFIKADALFHRAILHAAHNEFLRAMEGVIYSALLVSIRITNKDPLKNGASIPFHIEVYEAIASRDGIRAESLTERLLEDACQRLNCGIR